MDKNKKDKLKLMIGIVLCAAIMAVAYFAYSNLQNKAKPQLVTQDGDSFEDDTSSGKETLTPAPDIEVEDADGNLVKLSDFKGTPVIINLWASWCPPCKSEMPLFDKKSKEYAGKIQFMMINLTAQDEISTAKSFVAESGYTFPVFYDTNNDAGTKYYTPGIPATFFVNSKGEAVAYITGAINEETLEEGIEMICK